MATILKYVWRFFSKQPFFTFVAVTILALGVGANTAMFAIVYSVLLKPLPYPNYKELVSVWDVQDKQTGPMSYAEFESLSARSGLFQSVAAYFSQNSVISSDGIAERISVLRASTKLLPLLDQHPLMGPGFSRDADTPGSNHEMMISMSLWRRHYGGDTGIIGKTSILGQQLYTIVGVLPDDFQFVKNAEALIPLRLNASVAPPDLHFLNVVGRLRPGTRVEEASAELRSSATPSQNSHGLQLVGLQSEMVSGMRTPALLLFAATILTLLIACANVGNLLLVQSAGRRREVAIRLALGASRGHIILKFLMESYMIALAGGLAGAVVAWLVLRWGRNSVLVLLPRSDEIHLYDNVLLFTLGIALVVGLALGLGTILQTKVKDIHGALRGVRQAGASLFVRRWLDSLVISEIALTVVLLVGSGLLIRSFVKLIHENKGFVPDRIFSLEFYLFNKSYTPEQTLAFYSQMRQQLTAMPGIENVGVVNTVPLTGSIDGTIDVRGSEHSPATNLSAAKILADGEYFSILTIPLIAGRLFNEHDSLEGRRVAIIDETLARKICGQGSCLGRSVDFSWGKQEWAEIVGVVGAVRQDNLETSPKPTIYVPYLQKPDLLDTIALKMVVRSPLKRDIAEAEFRQALVNVDKTQPPPKIKTISEILDASLVTREVILSLLGLFGALALFLSILGVYSVIAYSVMTRRAEFGVRMAMGAQSRHILNLVLGHGLRLAGIGIGIGLICSVFGIRLLASMLYGITAFDTFTFLAVMGMVAVVVVAACWIPGRRALTVEPSISLKAE
jgi:putative ABC transport system permease protein